MTLFICQDLIFSSKVTGTARALGSPIKQVPSVAKAIANISPEISLAIVDLSSPPTTTADDLRQLKAALPASARLVAYGSHVDAQRLKQAKEAGCDLVLPRSAFVDQLTELLTPHH